MAIFKSHLYQLAAYKPPLEGRDPNKHLLLDFNERTLPISAPIRDALTEFVQGERVQMYPAYGDIVARLAKYTGARDEQIMITNGSDQGIELVFRACCRAEDEVIIPAPNFAMYHQCAKIENTRIIEPHYTLADGFPTDEVIAAVTEKTRVICIANPNNPSGVGVSREDIVRVAQAAPNACILVDECYFEYSQLSVIDLIDQYSNIVVTRTFSKTWGLPSLRFGYLIASQENINVLLSVRGPYDVNQLAVVAAKAALENPEYTQHYIEEVMQHSKPLFEDFLGRHNILYWPSCANYLWVFVDNAEDIERELAGANILVRPKADISGRIGLRITLGSLAQTKKLISVFESAL